MKITLDKNWIYVKGTGLIDTFFSDPFYLVHKNCGLWNELLREFFPMFRYQRIMERAYCQRCWAKAPKHVIKKVKFIIAK